MLRYVAPVLCCLLLSCGITKYYVVRHAEKETTGTMTSDVPLSEAGRQRAVALKDLLQDKKIIRIFSTNYKRTLATAQPLSDVTGVRIETYNPADTNFIQLLKQVTQGDVLVVGHSNTVDNLVNGLAGKNVLQDLPDMQYGDLFVITKRGKKYKYAKVKFGR